jgi:hypothetical protein
LISDFDFGLLHFGVGVFALLFDESLNICASRLEEFSDLVIEDHGQIGDFV